MRLYDRCMGACCEDIGLFISPDQLKKSYDRWKSVESTNARLVSMNPSPEQTIYSDIHLIYPMLTFKKENYKHPANPHRRTTDKVYHYTCKHYDSKKRACSIYEDRPQMCRTYPDGGFCTNPKCQWKEQVKGRAECQKQN